MLYADHRKRFQKKSFFPHFLSFSAKSDAKSKKNRDLLLLRLQDNK